MLGLRQIMTLATSVTAHPKLLIFIGYWLSLQHKHGVQTGYLIP